MNEYYGNNDWRDYLAHHGVKGQKWGVRNGPPYPINKSKKFDPFKAMDDIDKDLSAYLIAVDYHGKYKDEHPIDGKILGIAAKKEARGKGITDDLILKAKKHYKNDKLVAEIDKDNISSRKLFERNGFKKEYSDDYIDYYTWTKRRKEG